MITGFSPVPVLLLMRSQCATSEESMTHPTNFCRSVLLSSTSTQKSLSTPELRSSYKIYGAALSSNPFSDTGYSLWTMNQYCSFIPVSSCIHVWINRSFVASNLNRGTVALLYTHGYDSQVLQIKVAASFLLSSTHVQLIAFISAMQYIASKELMNMFKFTQIVREEKRVRWLGLPVRNKISVNQRREHAHFWIWILWHRFLPCPTKWRPISTLDTESGLSMRSKEQMSLPSVFYQRALTIHYLVLSTRLEVGHGPVFFFTQYGLRWCQAHMDFMRNLPCAQQP